MFVSVFSNYSADVLLCLVGASLALALGAVDRASARLAPIS